MFRVSVAFFVNVSGRKSIKIRQKTVTLEDKSRKMLIFAPNFRGI